MILRLLDWSAGLDKVQLTKLIRAKAGMPLNEAHQLVNRFLDGEAVEILVNSKQAAVGLSQAIGELGVRVEIVDAEISTH